MKNVHKAVQAIAGIALAGVVTSPACAAPALVNIMNWPGPYAVVGYSAGLVRFGQEFFGIAVESGKAPVDFGTVFRMTSPSDTHAKWHTSIVYDFATQNAPSKGQAFQAQSPLSVDGGGRVYGFAKNNCTVSGPCAIIYMLQPPSSGSGPWTRTDIWNFQKSDRIANSGGVIPDGHGHLFGVGGTGNSDCSTDPAQCGAVFELSPNTTRTSWTFKIIYPFHVPGERGLSPIFDKSGNLFFTDIPDTPDPIRSSVEELSPPSEHGSPWTHTTIWRSKPGQLQSPTGLAIGPDGNLIVTAFGTEIEDAGVFKLIRPATSAGTWAYRPVWAQQGYGSIGYGLSLPALIDASGVLFVQGHTDFVSIAPPAALGQPWVAQEIIQTGSGPFYFGNRALTYDAAGEILFPSNQTEVYALQGSGFVPPHSAQ